MPVSARVKLLLFATLPRCVSSWIVNLPRLDYVDIISTKTVSNFLLIIHHYWRITCNAFRTLVKNILYKRELLYTYACGSYAIIASIRRINYSALRGNRQSWLKTRIIHQVQEGYPRPESGWVSLKGPPLSTSPPISSSFHHFIVFIVPIRTYNTLTFRYLPAPYSSLITRDWCARRHAINLIKIRYFCHQV